MVGDGTGGRHPLFTPRSLRGGPVLSPRRARQVGRRARRRLPAVERSRATTRLSRRITATPWFLNARIVVAYSAMPEEPELDAVMAAAIAAGKMVLLPVVGAAGELSLRRWTPATRMRTNRYGIAEPVATSRRGVRVGWRMRCVVCAPLTAFDGGFNRVGMGSGYYDRLFARTAHLNAVRRIGIAFDCQRVDAIDPQPWDEPLHGVATDTRIYRTRSSET